MNQTKMMLFIGKQIKKATWLTSVNSCACLARRFCLRNEVPARPLFWPGLAGTGRLSHGGAMGVSCWRPARSAELPHSHINTHSCQACTGAIVALSAVGHQRQLEWDLSHKILIRLAGKPPGEHDLQSRCLGVISCCCRTDLRYHPGSEKTAFLYLQYGYRPRKGSLLQWHLTFIWEPAKGYFRLWPGVHCRGRWSCSVELDRILCSHSIRSIYNLSRGEWQKEKIISK